MLQFQGEYKWTFCLNQMFLLIALTFYKEMCAGCLWAVDFVALVVFFLLIVRTQSEQSFCFSSSMHQAVARFVVGQSWDPFKRHTLLLYIFLCSFSCLVLVTEVVWVSGWDALFVLTDTFPAYAELHGWKCTSYSVLLLKATGDILQHLLPQHSSPASLLCIWLSGTVCFLLSLEG